MDDEICPKMEFNPLPYFNLTSDISILVNKCHSKVEKSERQSMRQNSGKSFFFCMISTTLTKSWAGGTGWFML